MSMLSLLSAAAFVIYALMGTYALKQDVHARINQVFFLLCFNFATWSLGRVFMDAASNAKEAEMWHDFSAVGFCFFAPVILHFLILMVHKEKLFAGKFTLTAIYVPAGIFFVQVWTGDLTTNGFVETATGWMGIAAVDTLWYQLYIAYCLLCVVAGLSVLAIWGIGNKQQHERRQAIAIFVGAIISFFLSTITEVIFPYVGINLPGLAQILGLFWMSGVAYAIFNMKLMRGNGGFFTEEVLSKAKDMIVLLDARGVIVRANQRLLDVLGYKEKEIVGRKADCLVVKEDRGYITKGFLRMYEGGNANKKGLSLSYVDKFGSSCPILLNTSPIRDQEGDLVGLVAVARDMRLMRDLEKEIDDRTIAEDALRKANKRLEDLDKIKTDFLSTVSHELRTPLTSILGFTKMIYKKYSDVIIPALLQVEDLKVKKAEKAISENLSIMLEEGMRLSILINDVLDIARLESGKAQMDLSYFSPESVLDEAVASADSLINGKNMQFVKEFSCHNLMVKADYGYVLQVLLNLLSNAVKFTYYGGHINCGCTREGDNVVFYVSDDGIGIVPEDMEKIFDRFHQIGDTLTDKPKGAGLGLYLSRLIVERHGGSIWASSEPGRGSRFSFTLPVDYKEIAG